MSKREDRIKKLREKRALMWEKYWLNRLGKKITPVGVALIFGAFGVLLGLGQQNRSPESILKMAAIWAGIYLATYFYFEVSYKRYLKDKNNASR